MSQAPHPRMHGLTHVAGGSDPIPLFPTSGGGYVEQVLNHPALLHYWRMGAASGDQPDVSGNPGGPFNLHPQTGGVAGSYDVPGALNADDDDGAYQTHAGGNTVADSFATVTGHRAAFAGTASFSIECWAWRDPAWTTAGDVGGLVSMTTGTGTADGWQLNMTSGGRMLLARGTTGSFTTLTVNSGVWHHIVATYDGTTSRIYLDGALWFSEANAATVAAGTNPIRVFRSPATFPDQHFWGIIDEVALYGVALSAGDVRSHYDGGIVSSAVAPGEVLTVGEDGQPSWDPPGVTVEHGGGTPAENPVTTPGGAYTGFPANPSGWHYAAHTETAVLYDSTPARFDVPSMKWVRTPFNTVRIQRRWELTVGGQFKDAWLPDDRGLTDHARNGLLHITPEMVSATVKHVIDGFFSIEYPVLDYQGLPDFTGGGGIIAPDQYTRAGRVLNASTGVVLRRLPGSTQRRFMQWEWLNDADGMAVSVLYTVDNPYPLYPVWPARPLTLPQPYPKLSPTDSLDYYLTAAGNPGFGDGTFALEQNLVAGDNLCLQGWQDSPWLLRFSTDHFPPWNPWPYTEVWRRRPFLSVTYTYDPDSVDHTTGKLL